jgi:hypothetical protein
MEICWQNVIKEFIKIIPYSSPNFHISHLLHCFEKYSKPQRDSVLFSIRCGTGKGLFIKRSVMSYSVQLCRIR